MRSFNLTYTDADLWERKATYSSKSQIDFSVAKRMLGMAEQKFTKHLILVMRVEK